MNENYTFDTNNAIALCHIIDDFKEFERRLLPLISPKYNRDFVYQLWHISKGDFCLCARKAKRFYRENKRVIDTISEYSNIATFINGSYDWYGNPVPELQLIYNYILKHKSELDHILTILEKLKKLGFTRFDFNEDFDFTKETYETSKSFWRIYREIVYVANIEIIPSYFEPNIKYKTLGSNYKIELERSFDNISEYRNTIFLNSLLFDPNSLPERIDKESTYDYILGLASKQDEKTRLVKSSVDLSVGINDLNIQLAIFAATINELDGVKNKEEMLRVLSSLKGNIEELKALSLEHDKSIEEETDITQEILEDERTLYLRRREEAKIDYD